MRRSLKAAVRTRKQSGRRPELGPAIQRALEKNQSLSALLDVKE